MGDNRALLKLVQAARGATSRAPTTNEEGKRRNAWFTLMTYHQQALGMHNDALAAEILEHVRTEHTPNEPKYTPLPLWPCCVDDDCPGKYNPKMDKVRALQSYVRWGSTEEVAAIRKHIRECHPMKSIHPVSAHTHMRLPECDDPRCPEGYRPAAMQDLQPVVDKETCGHCGDREPCDACPFFLGCPRHNGSKKGLSDDEGSGGMATHQEPATGYREPAPLAPVKEPGFLTRLSYWFGDYVWLKFPHKYSEDCCVPVRVRPYTLRDVFFPRR